MKDLPAPGRAKLISSFGLLSSWILLNGLGVDPQAAFVWSGIMAAPGTVWVQLPTSVERHQRHGRFNGLAIFGTVFAVFLGLSALLVIWSDPDVAQRLLSIVMSFYLALMILGLLGDAAFFDGFAPQPRTGDVADAVRRQFLRIRVVGLILAIAINESLVIFDAPLWARIVVLALLPSIIHYGVCIAGRLTVPSPD